MKPTIGIIDLTNTVGYAQLQIMANAMEKQVMRDVSPHWLGVDGKPIDAQIVVYRSLSEVPKGVWKVTIERNIQPTNNAAVAQLAKMDKVYSATLYGYHLVDEKGVPYARILQTGNISKVLSHEIVEMLVNPYLDRYIGADLYSENPGDEKVIQEIADPVQATGYLIDGIEVSNFILPSWYHLTKTEGIKYDFLGIIKEPKKILVGGYKSYLTRAGEWVQSIATEFGITFSKLGSDRKFDTQDTYRIILIVALSGGGVFLLTKLFKYIKNRK